MSDLIRLLPDHIANQIAAGEVVQRPASVIKELVENCIDAGATKIDIVIKDAGRTLIQVTDNGKGMSPVDARMAFERHATSKIQAAEDLYALTTKGFRGEALASIAAVAQVTLKTKRPGDDFGTSIQIEANKIIQQEPVQCAEGASFEVKNLFYNIPARRNFLKSDNIEFKHIIDDVERVALAHPDIAFRLIHNEQEIYNLFAVPLRKRIVDVFGKNYSDKLVPVNEVTDIVRIEGFVCKPEAARKTRGEQFFFVNNRFFRDNYFNHAVSAAFEDILPPKHFPTYFLFFEVDPKHIDVNVHPTKTEIKFEEDKAIYSILRSTVMAALGKYNIKPTLDFERETSFDVPAEIRNQPAVEPVIRVNPFYNPFEAPSTGHSRNNSNASGKAFTSALHNQGFGASGSSGFQGFWSGDMDELPEITTESEQQELHEKLSRPTGPFLRKGHLVLCSVEEGLMVIHFQRANEKLLYERSMTNFMYQPLESQQLLFPLTKTCGMQDKLVWENHKNLLERVGFQWTWNEVEMEISGIPSLLNEQSIHLAIDMLLERFQMGEIDAGEIVHVIIDLIARAASNVRIQSMNESEIEQFIEHYFELDNVMFTAKGKKIIGIISNQQLLNVL